MDYQAKTELNPIDINYHLPVLITEIANFVVLNQPLGYRQTKKIWQPQISNSITKKQTKSEDGLSNSNVVVFQDKFKNYVQETNSDQGTLKSDLKIFDGTLGGLGYFDFIANLCQEKQVNLDYFGCDLDPLVIEKAELKIKLDKISSSLEIKPHTLQLSTCQTVSSQTTNLKKSYQIELNAKQASFLEYIEEFPDNFFDGIILDLGFSSNQLATGGRGFSYQKTSELLDLRYDSERGLPCWQKLAQIKTPSELGNVIYRFSGEKLAQKIAANLLNFIENLKVETKQKFPPLSVEQVVDIISASIPAIFRKKTNQILSRVWQALRIWTNDELEVLTNFLPAAVEKLAIGGQLAIVSFHSLEDKIVTSFMRTLAAPTSDEFGNKIRDFKLLTSRAIVASPQELTDNPRSRSALLRVLKRLS